MNCKKESSRTCCKGKRLFAITSFVLTGLLVLDIICQGVVFKRLPKSWQHTLLEWTDR